jgi:hypothetical protein
MDRIEGMVMVGGDMVVGGGTDVELILSTPKKETGVGCFEEYGLALYHVKRYFGAIMRCLNQPHGVLII